MFTVVGETTLNKLSCFCQIAPDCGSQCHRLLTSTPKKINIFACISIKKQQAESTVNTMRRQHLREVLIIKKCHININFNTSKEDDMYLHFIYI